MRYAFLGVMLFAVATFAMGCSSPMDVVVPLGKDATHEFDDAIRQLDQGQRKALSVWMVRSAITGEPFPVMTVGEALEDQSKWEVAEAKREADKKAEEAKRAAEEDRLRAEAEAKKKKMRDAADVFLLSKEFIPSDFRAGRYQEYMQISCSLRNNGDKDISGMKGTMDVLNLFGDTIFSVQLTVQELIPAGASVEWVGSMEYNKFIEEHRSFVGADMEKIKTTWIPENILFADGSSMP